MNSNSDPDSYAFPDGFPHDCPPKDAPHADCEVFRVVKCDPPCAEDFASWAEQGKVDPKRECDCFGVSVFRDRDDAEFYADKYPHLGELVAKAKLSPKDGKLASTPRILNGVENSHSTWWPFRGVSRHALFVLVAGS